jgi:hypothetical protein
MKRKMEDGLRKKRRFHKQDTKKQNDTKWNKGWKVKLGMKAETKDKSQNWEPKTKQSPIRSTSDLQHHRLLTTH